MQNKKFKFTSKAFQVGEKWFDACGKEYFIVSTEEQPYQKVVFNNGGEIKEQDIFSFQAQFFHHSAFKGLNKSEQKILEFARSLGLGSPGYFSVETLIDSFRNLRVSNAMYRNEITEIHKTASERAYQDALVWAKDEAIKERVKNMTVEEFANFLSTNGDQS